jgi:hypothetical protein
MDYRSDVRPRVVRRDDAWVLAGFTCQECGYRLAVAAPWCPVCHGALEDAEFGPGGTVWGSTILRVPVGGFDPPRGLAYVDLDAGPRLICQIAEMSEVALPVGSRVALTGPSPEGNPVARASE